MVLSIIPLLRSTTPTHHRHRSDKNVNYPGEDGEKDLIHHCHEFTQVLL